MVMAGFGHRVMPCPPEALREALEVLYHRVPEALRYRLVMEVLEETRRGELDLSGLWIVGKPAGRIVGTLLTQHLAGRAAAVWAPEVRATWFRAGLAASLVRVALGDLKARDFQLAQAVLDESATKQAAQDLTRGGMPRVTELLYLERETVIPLPADEAKSARRNHTGSHSPRCVFNWRAFEPGLESEFRSVMRATYRGSLDMPELEGTRSLDDVITGYRAAGRFKPERWRLGNVPGNPEAAAVLLLAQAPGRDAWEVVYLGLTPEARGQGLGYAVLQHALDLAQGQASRLELAVDCRNKPATRLYHSAGFTIRDRRAVHLAILSEQRC